MKITSELVQKSGGLIALHPEVNDWTGKKFMMFDDGGVELEVGEFLYGLMRVLKPDRVLETGTYTGISAMYMAQGLKDNGFGSLSTIEIDLTHKARAEELWKRVGVDDFATCIHTDARGYRPHEDDMIDFMFLDSEPEMRFDELVRFFPNLKPGGYVFIHDLHRHMGQGQPVNPDHPEIPNWPWGELPKQIKDWVKDGDLRPMHFPTPRGLLGLYKTHPSDYRWV